MRVGQVVKLRNFNGTWQYERIFAIGKCPVHKGLHHYRITDQCIVPDEEGISIGDQDCGCVGEIKGGLRPLSFKECFG